MTRLRSAAVFVTATAVTLCVGVPRQVATAQTAPARIILILGDGVGTGYWTAAAFAADKLAVEQFPVMGLINTRSSDSKITDSAAAATAYSTGVRTYNGGIGVDPDSCALTTVLEVARDRGMATGLVATSSITHATPAAFAAHVPNRNMEWEIARQLVAARIDVVLGGGRRYFDGAQRPDSVDLQAVIRAEYSLVETAEELRALDVERTAKLWGLFAYEHMPAARTRTPTLPEMTRAALSVVDRNPQGFFLMIEGSQPDWRGHDNEPLSLITAEMLDLDRAIGVALEYQNRHPETLIVVAADHETGGLAVQFSGSRRLLSRAAAAADTTAAQLMEAASLTDPALAALADTARLYMERLSTGLRSRARHVADSTALVARYTTGTHTAQMVPLFASGPGAERFGGMKDNWRIGRLLLEAMRQGTGTLR